MKKTPLLAFALGLTFLSACGASATPAIATIKTPTNQQQFNNGQPVKIEGSVSGSGIKKVEVVVGQDKVAVVDQAAQSGDFVISFDWPPPPNFVGTTVIQLKGVNESGQVVVASDTVFVNIKGLPPTLTPEPPPPTLVPTAVVAPPTATAIPPTPKPISLTNADNLFVNVRKGPGLTFDILGQLKQNESANAKGKSADGQWIQIEFKQGDGGVGWLSAGLVKLGGDANTLAVVQASGQTVTTTTTTTTTVAQPTTAPAAGTNAITNADNEFVNVRNGPGLNYAIAGQLKQTASANVKGKSEDGQWWQIEFAQADKGLGWVFGNLVKFNGNAGAIPVVKVAAPPAQPTLVPIATAAPTQPPAPTAPAASLLPYSQNVRFAPRDDIGDVPLGYNGEAKSSSITWNITGARSAELEITAQAGPGIFDQCPAGNLGSISPNNASGKRIPIQLPTGSFAFSITEKGYYLFKIYVVKADGSTTDIPRNVIVDCYKR